VILIALFLGAVGQAGELDADIACVASQISPDQRAAMTVEVAGPGRGPVREAFRAAAAACARDRSWATDYSEHVERIAGAQLLRAAADERLARAGIRSAVIDDWWASMPPTFNPSGPDVATSVSALFERLVASGIDEAAVEAQAEVVGWYVGALGLEREARRAIAARGRAPGA
jgi:hypothetical protein